MVKLWRLVGYRIKVPPETSVYDLLTEFTKITPVCVVEELAIPNHYAVVVPEGMGWTFEEYFKKKGYDYLPADIYFRTRIMRRR